METFRYNRVTCPWECGAELDSFTQTIGSREEPNDGDFSVCIHCGNWLQIKKEGDKITLIKPSVNTISNLSIEELEMLTHATEVVKEVNRRIKEKENEQPTV